MVNELKNIITRKFNKDILFDCQDWRVVLNMADNVPIFCLKSSVDYYVEYFKGKSLSFVIYENNKAVGVFPVFVHECTQGWKISGNGIHLIQPIFVRNISKKNRKRLERKIIEIIEEISNKLKIETIQLFDANYQLSSWYLLWLKRANKSFVTHQLMVDLSYSINNIKLKFRKSYKPLVNKSLREWDISVCTKNLDKNFNAFRMLHLEVAGKETRSKKSWDIQRQQIENNEAFLVMVKDNDTLVGAGLFSYTKDIGSYSVGAYKRELFDKPIGHGVQMKAIETLQEKGCRVYHIGQKMTLLDESASTDKEQSISHFKEGFSSYVCTQAHLKVKINE